MYLGVLRAQNRTSYVALVQGVRAALILGLALVLVKYMGILGAGVAVLVSQVVMALFVLPGLVKVLRAGGRSGQVRARQAGVELHGDAA
jgi:Na+-driven multidrug efflux pump